jgi:peroxiredoxin
MNFARVLFIATLFAIPAFAYADAQPNEPAPAFELKDSNGKVHKLADHAGKDIVVLEWLNYDCPFVRKHYDTKNMQGLQQKYTGKGITWYSIISSGAGQEGNFSPKEVNERNKKEGAHQTAVLLDYDGKVGKAYGAKTTPHMFVIGKDGKIAYLGGIDDKRSTDKEDVKIAKNFVASALDEIIAGKPVSKGSAPAYGCSVHYASK